MTVGELAAGRANGFDALRLAAAAAVLVSHAYVLTGRPEPLVGSHSWGALGVHVFFAISGFLICRSWCASPRLRSFVIKRALRILPALVATLVACAYVLGPVASSFAPGDYLAGGEAPGYVLANLLAVVTGGLATAPEYGLPGLFAANPHAGVVNGSLWTLPIETEAYAMVALLGVTGVVARGLPAVAAAGLALTAAMDAGVSVPVLGARPETVVLLTTFSVGGLVWLWRDRVPVRLDAAAVTLVAWLVALGSPAEGLATALAVPYLTVAVALRAPVGIRRVAAPGDVSYGLYLLAFPVQQCIVAAWGGGGPRPGVLVALALPATYALALASWRCVEAPALRLKTAAAGEPARPVLVGGRAG